MDHSGYDQVPSSLHGCDLIQDASPDMPLRILNYWSLCSVRKPHSENEEIKLEPSCNGIEVSRKTNTFTSHVRHHNSSEFCESGLSDLSPCKSETTSQLHVEVKTEDSMWPDTPNLSENTPAHVSTCQNNECGNAVKDKSPISVFSTRDQPTATVAESAASDWPVPSVTQESRGSCAQVILLQQSSVLQQEITPSGLNDLSASQTRHVSQHHADVNQGQSAHKSMQPTTTPGSSNSAPTGMMRNEDDILKAIEKCPLCAESNGSHQQQDRDNWSEKDKEIWGNIKRWNCCACGYSFPNIWRLTYHRDNQHNCHLENPELRTRFHSSQDSKKNVLTQPKETPLPQVIKTESSLKPVKQEPSAHNSMQATTTPGSSKPVPSSPMLIDEKMEVKTEDSMWPETPNLSENTPAHVSTCQNNECGNAVKDKSPISVFSTRDQPTATVAEPAASDWPVPSVTQESRGSSAQVILLQQSSVLQQEITPSGLNDLSANQTRHVSQHHADVNQGQSAHKSMQPTTTPGSSNSAPTGMMRNEDDILKAIEKCPLCAESNGSHQQQDRDNRSEKDKEIWGNKERWKCCICGIYYHNIWNLTYHREKQHNCHLENPELRTRSHSSQDSEKNVLTQPKETPLSQVIKTESSLKAVKQERSARNSLQAFFPMLTDEFLKGNEICELCSKSNGSHKQEDQANRSEKDEGKKKKIKPWKCCSCKKTFLRLSNLISHRQTHLKSDLECPECKHRFHSRYFLEKHMSITHSKERPFSCSDCDKAFRTVSQLNIHVTISHASPKHICEECGKGFRVKNNLHIHMNVHTGHRPFQCPECDAVFKTPSALKTHRIVHTGERPFPCPKCPSRFRFKGNLKNHLATHTSSEGPQRSASRRSRSQAESSDSEEASPSDTDSPHDSSPPGPTARETRSRKRLKLLD